ncbi:MAG TPA: PQQ-dependent sugar dehydrogenase, partial [Candidatus Saccharimonadales bacterium]|nr:PQQ-dependent sugar dehydrogenase [Candidatus Saccharimonadales bacterium]
MKCSLPCLLLVCTLLAQSVSRSETTNNFPAVTMQLAYPELTVQRPVWLCEAPDGSGRIFLVEQTGKILILPKDKKGKEAQVFLDITDRKPHASNEEGLLGLAFHPEFKSNGKFYIFYTQQGPRRNLLSELQVDKKDGSRADLSSERVLMEVPKIYPNHNGSTLLFGP